jgi:NTP pyrophosphatase (non-canonical NTP hydrolase)
MNVDLNRYKDFVQGVTSGASEDLEVLIARMRALQSSEPQLNVALLVTAGIGLASEGGEFDEIVKKLIFQGKPWNEENRHHMFRELGDIAWYWVSACRAIGVDPNEVIEENVRKLESRYPGGTFDVHYSENRKTGDL